MERRSFIKRAGLATAALWIPNFLKPLEKFAVDEYRNLVIIQLSGGNDGLNTIIPFENDIYYNSRKTIAIAKNDVLKLTDDMGFHPAMPGLQGLYNDGLMCVINSVGYPNPNRSHFRSMDIWQSATGANEYKNTGWIGRYLDSSCNECNHPYLALELDQTLSLALKGDNKKGIAVNNPQQLYNQTREPFFKQLKDLATDNDHDNVAYLYKTMAETYASAEYIFETNKTYKNDFEYPKNNLARQLKQIATFIASGLNTRVYYASMGGFDTHVAQLNRQEDLLKQFSESVTAFIQNLKSTNKLNDTMVLVFSEFGRRVNQNASNGTDHGTANNVFILGSALKKRGFYNAAPDLANLEDGDLKYQVDFRHIYATLLNSWLKIAPDKILGKNFDYLNFI
ncbi:MAG TPA: DUF1501 domain-containing protein [Bacteroidia bacterium]|jgi:uncharacterized protein (DUF1501 family)|nr:DUF1501 domain-containing protein [Bacteroidia bacterium]